jgi:polygalacturonase
VKRFLAPIVSLAFALTTLAGDFNPPKIQTPTFPDKTYDVKEFGATGDGKTNDTPAINKAINQAISEGGGTIKFPAGKYMAASIHLKSNIQFVLDDNATIEGLKYGYDAPEPNEKWDKYQDFGHSHFHNAVMWGENLENFAMVGGKLNGGGAITGDPKRPTTQPDGSHAWGGDKVISIKVGKNLLFKNVTHETGGHFVYLLNDCENITINNIVIKKSRDALDLMGCRNVAVSECNFTGCSDDTLGIKSDYALGRRIKTENIYAWNNYFESGCNGQQFGSETAGDFKNVNIWNIKIGLSMKAGIGITCNDSAVIEDLHYKNIDIKKAANPIYMLITRRMRTGEEGAQIGTIRNVKIENVTCTDVVAGKNHGPAHAATISGLPERSIENITLENVKIVYKGGEPRSEATTQPVYPKDYSPRSLGTRPASGFYVRHVKGLTFKNCEIDYESANEKPVLIFEDVHGLALDRFRFSKPAGMEAVRFENVSAVNIKDSGDLKDETIEKLESGTR